MSTHATPDPRPEAILDSPEKAELVRAIDHEVADAWIREVDNLVTGPNRGLYLRELRLAIESRSIAHPQLIGPRHRIGLDRDQLETVRQVFIREVHRDGGAYEDGLTCWRSDGTRLWRTML